MITSIHHESLYPVIKILQKKRILLQPFSSKVLSKKTLIPCSWALQKQRLLNFLQTLLIIHGFFKSHFLTIRDFNIAKVLLNIKRSTHFNLQVFCSDHFICIQPNPLLIRRTGGFSLPLSAAKTGSSWIADVADCQSCQKSGNDPFCVKLLLFLAFLNHLLSVSMPYPDIFSKCFILIPSFQSPCALRKQNTFYQWQHMYTEEAARSESPLRRICCHLSGFPDKTTNFKGLSVL